MRVVTTLPQNNLTQVPAAAHAAEAAGYDAVMTLENRHEPFLPLVLAATATERLTLATGVAIAFARSPMVVANTAWDLQSASHGRFVLGLGSQVKGHNERRFSVPWSPPAPRIKEYVQALRAIWGSWRTGERLAFEGDHYRFTLMTPNFVPEPIEAPPPPVTIGAVGPAMLRVAGAVCDGVKLHPFCTRRYVERVVLPTFEDGLAARGMDRAHFEIAGGGFLATGADDAAVAERVDWVRQRVAFYGSTRVYWPVLAEHGLEDLGLKLHEMVKAGQWADMAAAVDDDTVALFAAIGRYDEIVPAIRDRFEGLCDLLYASTAPDVPGNLPPDLIQEIQRIPRTFRGFKADE
jgi:probable F420-dependent oxidoreductase